MRGVLQPMEERSDPDWAIAWAIAQRSLEQHVEQTVSSVAGVTALRRRRRSGEWIHLRNGLRLRRIG